MSSQLHPLCSLLLESSRSLLDCVAVEHSSGCGALVCPLSLVEPSRASGGSGRVPVSRLALHLAQTPTLQLNQLHALLVDPFGGTGADTDPAQAFKGLVAFPLYQNPSQILTHMQKLTQQGQARDAGRIPPAKRGEAVVCCSLFFLCDVVFFCVSLASGVGGSLRSSSFPAVGFSFLVVTVAGCCGRHGRDEARGVAGARTRHARLQEEERQGMERTTGQARRTRNDHMLTDDAISFLSPSFLSLVVGVRLPPPALRLFLRFRSAHSLPPRPLHSPVVLLARARSALHSPPAQSAGLQHRRLRPADSNTRHTNTAEPTEIRQEDTTATAAEAMNGCINRQDPPRQKQAQRSRRARARRWMPRRRLRSLH